MPSLGRLATRHPRALRASGSVLVFSVLSNANIMDGENLVNWLVSGLVTTATTGLELGMC